MSVFLTAEWRQLLMLNDAVDPALLQGYLPRGVELDTWNGTNYLSVVGFLFQNTRVLGVKIPGHVDFEEVNLRFYVRRKTPDGWRRGVVFIKEIVPRRAIAVIARRFYNEPYVACPMRHRVDLVEGYLRAGSVVEYGWRFNREWNSLKAVTVGQAEVLKTGGEEEFITEHYWGYTAQRNDDCTEYQVEHDPWKVWQVKDAGLVCDVEAVYGKQFVEVLAGKPKSAFVAEGSEVKVYTGVKL